LEVAEPGFGDEGVGEAGDEFEVVVGEFGDGGEAVAEGVLGCAEAAAGGRLRRAGSRRRR
jgi:hypothetical protein